MRSVLHCGDRQFVLGERVLVMGILNLTPDSFSDGGALPSVDAAVARAEQLLEDGADVLDLGGESTRPGAAVVDVDEERRRVLPVIEALTARGITALSVDTRKAAVARDAVDAGARWVNDVSGLADPDMVSAATSADALVIMHWEHALQAGQRDDGDHHRDVVAEVCAWLGARLQRAVDGGVDPARVLLDPGVGFGKSLDDNVALTRGLDALHQLGTAGILYGPSRKRFLGALVDEADAARRDPATIGAACAAALAGADVVRVHDVRGVQQALRAFAALRPER